MLLLDTCTLLMLGGRQNDLSAKAVAAIESDFDNLYISVISAFEIALKQRLGKLELPLSAGEWYAKALAEFQLQELTLTCGIAIRAAELPLIHKDPCDRIIIATSLESKMQIVTPDEIFAGYPEVRTLW